MKETEYKFLVDKETFEKVSETVKSRFPNAKVSERIQINYYYDTPDRYLRERNVTLRIRQIESDLTLELKEYVMSSQDYSEASEMSRKIERVCNDITLKKGKYAWIPFSLQGNLVTKRCSVKPTESLSIDFDVNYYLGRCDYEIEMEFTKNAHKATLMLIEKLGLMKYKNTVGGKAGRFFRCKAENSKG